MPNAGQKTPVARTLEQFAGRKARQAIELMGTSLPASVAAVVGSGIVTVNFELTNVPFTLPQITVPIIGSEYIRLPIRVGMKGLVIAADAYLGGMSGLGGGTADLAHRPNLSNLAFVPLGNKGWSAPDDPNAVVIYGPDGVVLRDLNKKTTLTLTAGGITITLQAGDQVAITGDLAITGNLLLGGTIEAHAGGTYAGDLRTAGNVIAGVGGADQVGLRTHTHASGTPNTGPPNPGT